MASDLNPQEVCERPKILDAKTLMKILLEEQNNPRNSQWDEKYLRETLEWVVKGGVLSGIIANKIIRIWINRAGRAVRGGSNRAASGRVDRAAGGGADWTASGEANQAA
ncbi:hypothetical protein CRG98_040666 [Punica granatum]|uniref:Uncharacterized protein n=1 Tax=Punica granatum TaxID=22663 RepID=A0A2I0I4Q8_PUNGR|nr:hypothetical protein CRG98_040666 [Punica granatum]